MWQDETWSAAVWEDMPGWLQRSDPGNHTIIG